MSDLSFVLEPPARGAELFALPAWKEMERDFRSGDVPHCRAVSAPLEYHLALLPALARLYLCFEGTGSDGCPSCSAWSAGAHPDLIVAGGVGKAPSIDECRTLIQELALKPVSARRRLGVAMSADRLFLPAANSLLKIAEEPPSHACLLFLLEGSGLLPTLRSRARFTVLTGSAFIERTALPEDDAAWLDWVKKQKGDGIAGCLAQWATHALCEGDVGRAAKAERLRLIAEQEKLSPAMLCDLLTLALKEELPFEHIFGNLW